MILFSVEVERPFPVEVVKKLLITVPKPYPVHVVYYKHISEDDATPPNLRNFLGSQANKYGSLPVYGGEISARQHHEHQFSGY